MARFRSSNLHPVNRIKHVVDSSATVTAATVVNFDLVKSVDAPVIANTSEVITGSKVNALYLRVEVAPTETDVGAIPNCYMAVYKSPANLAGNIDPSSTGDEINKRFIIHQEMVMFNNLAGGNPRTLFNGVIVIPKGYRRFAPADRLRITLKSSAVNFAYCLQGHYKEFR